MEAKEKKSNTKLQHERLCRGWSQKKVGLEIGTSKEMVSRWETGERTPSLYYQEQLCKLFGLSTEDLGFLDPPQDEPTPQEVLPMPTSNTSSNSLRSLLCSAPDTIMVANKCSYVVPHLTVQRGYFHDHDFPFLEDRLRGLG